MADEVTSVQLVPESRLSAPTSEGWGNAPTLIPPRSPLDRPMTAIRRYKWLVVGVTILSTIAGGIVTHFVKPEYEVKASIWIAAMTPQEANGPIRQRELLNAAAWVELAKSYKISDAVVRQLSLYLTASKSADKPLLKDFHLASSKIYPGTYTFHVDKRRNRWRLANEDANMADSGAVGDSVGRAVGVQWLPDSSLLARFSGRDIQFTVENPSS